MARLDLSYFNAIRIYEIQEAELQDFPENLLTGANVLSRSLIDKEENSVFYLYTLSYKHGSPYLLEQKMPKVLKNMSPDTFAQCSLQLAEGFKESTGIPPVSKRRGNKGLFEKAK